MTEVHALAVDVPSVSASVLTLRAELVAGTLREIGDVVMPRRDIRAMEGRDAVWVIVRRASGGGLAIRAAHTPGGCTRVRKKRALAGESLRFELDTAIGIQTLAVGVHAPDLPVCV